MVRHPALRSRDLSFEKACSIGFRSGCRAAVEQRRAGAFDEVAHARDFVAGQVLHDDEIPGSKLGGQDLFDIGQEHLAIHGPINDQRRGDRSAAQGGDEGADFPMPLGNCAD
jgi:hypothetical protein